MPGSIYCKDKINDRIKKNTIVIMLLVGNDGIIVCAFGIKQINNYGTALVC